MPKGGGPEAYGATVLRLALGGIYLMHAWAGLAVAGPEGLGQALARHGFPFPLVGAWYVILAHGLGGLGLILGVLARWAALVNVPVMLGAVFVVHWRQGFFLKPEGGYEFALLVLGATIAQALLGPGAFTLKR